MKSLPTLLAVGLALAALRCVNAQAVPAPAAEPEATWSFVLTPSVVSQYLFRGVRLGGSAFQPSIEADHGKTALGIWTSFPLRDKVPGQSDPEVDFYGSHQIVVNDTLNVQPGFTWYTYVNADPAAGFYRDTIEPSLALNWTVHGVLITPKLYYDLVAKGPTAELNLGYAIPLTALGTELDLSGAVGTYEWTDASAIHDPNTKNYGDYWQIGVAVPYQVTRSAKVTLGWAYAKGQNSYFKTGTDPRIPNTAAVGRGIFSLSCAWTF